MVPHCCIAQALYLHPILKPAGHQTGMLHLWRLGPAPFPCAATAIPPHYGNSPPLIDVGRQDAEALRKPREQLAKKLKDDPDMLIKLEADAESLRSSLQQAGVPLSEAVEQLQNVVASLSS